MIAVGLAKKIAELFIYLFIGFILVKTKALKKEDATVLTQLCIRIIMPCNIYNAFQIERTPAVLNGLIAAFITFSVIQFIYILMGRAFTLTGAGVVDSASVSYPNVGNLVIPLTASLFGPEWIIYVTGATTSFNLILWSYGINMFEDDRDSVTGSFSGKLGRFIKKTFGNPVNIAAILGIISFLLGFSLKGTIAGTAIETLAATVGPVSMGIIGMVLGGMKAEDFTGHKRLPLVVLMRMVICPLVIILLMRVTSLPSLIENGRDIMMIMLMCAAAPSANLISQLALLYDKDAGYASVISVVTTLSCILTMPLMVLIYETVIS